MSNEPSIDYVVAEVSDSPPEEARHEQTPLPPARRRKVKWPVILFILTCFSTFLTGSLNFAPMMFLFSGRADLARRFILTHWQEGLLFMLCVLAILLAHELGHFLATVVYRIPASLPIFLPFPFSPLGTLGAVIVMDGPRADRKQTFDIGIAGPLAGLVVAIPIMWIGIKQLDLTAQPSGIFAVDIPIAVRFVMAMTGIEGYTAASVVGQDQLNPYFMAGWVGCLVTALNMVPVSQLDGGHVTYTVFGKSAHNVGRIFMIFAVAYIVYMGASALVLMFLLVLVMGSDHPPTRDDRVPLGWFRIGLGVASLSIPLLLMPPRVIFFG